MCIVSITVTTATIALWLNHRMKHISSRGPYLSSRKAANSVSVLSPYKSRSSLHLWSEAPIFILIFALARSSSLFLLCFSLSVFLFPLFDVGNSEAFFGSVVVVYSPPLFTVWAWSIWPSKGRPCTCAGGKGTAKYAGKGGGAASCIYKRVIDTCQMLPLALIVCI